MLAGVRLAHAKSVDGFTNIKRPLSKKKSQNRQPCRIAENTEALRDVLDQLNRKKLSHSTTISLLRDECKLPKPATLPWK